MFIGRPTVKMLLPSFQLWLWEDFQEKTAFAQVTPPPPPAHILGNFRTFKKVSKSVWAGGSPPNLDNLSKRKGVLSRKFSLSFRQYIPQKKIDISNHV